MRRSVRWGGRLMAMGLVMAVTMSGTCAVRRHVSSEACMELSAGHRSRASSSHVVDIEPSNFERLLSEGQWLLEFYAPWCGFCKQFEPVYEEVAQDLKTKGYRVGRIDGSLHKALTARFAIQGFPTIFYINGHSIRKHSGDRSKEALVKFVESGYQVEPEAFSALIHPLSTWGKLLGMLVSFIVYMHDKYEFVREEFSLSHTMLLALLAVAAMVIGSFIGLVIASLMPAKKKVPQHQD
eukprot:764410-Hanusia_phi.AAC.6